MQTWDPTQFSIIILGNAIEGFAGGTFIKAARNEDAISIHVSSDGITARTRNANKSGRFSITLTNESPSNDILAAIAQADENGGTGVGPTFVKDGTGTAFAHGAESWVVKQGDLERAKELGDIEWIIECGTLDIKAGGITNVPGL